MLFPVIRIDDSIFKNIFTFHSDALIPDTVIGNDFLITQDSIGEEFEDKKRIHVLGNMVIDVSQGQNKVSSDREYYIEGRLKITENSIYNQFSMFYSRKGIEIQGSSNIRNAVFITDSTLHVLDGTIMRDVQMIARDTIRINGATLLFPATVISYRNKEEANPQIIEVQNSVVNGSLLMITSLPDTIQTGGNIIIDEQSKIWNDILIQPDPGSSFRPVWYRDRDENSNRYRFEIPVFMQKIGREIVWTISLREEYGKLNLSLAAEERLKKFFRIPDEIHFVTIRARMDKLSLAFRYKELIDQGHVKNQAELSRLLGVSEMWVSKVLKELNRGGAQ